ncbi:hypothetical protein HDU97_000288 [Phlyctochytrium planicorne]|nr:hypothetical protein HDU97_000288 [Phlyctochytrium planicorne]
MSNIIRSAEVLSDGEEVLKDENGNPQVVRKRGVFKIPFFALMFSYVTASVLVVGVIGWKYTLDAANEKLDALALKIQEQASHEVRDYISTFAMMLGQITAYQRDMFLADKWSFLPERRQSTLAGMLLLLNQFRPWWEQTNYTIFTSYLDAATNTWISKPDWTDPGNGTYENPGTNGTLQYESDHDYRYNVNFSDLSTFKIGTVYKWSADVYKTAISIVKNPVTQEVVLVGNDWTLGFIGEKFKEVLSTIEYSMFMAAIEISTGRLIATSNSSLQLSISDGVLSYDKAEDSYLMDFVSWIRDESIFQFSPTPKASIQDIAKSLSNTTEPIVLTRYINSTTFSLRLDLIPVPFDSDQNWLAVQYMDLDAVSAPLRQASKLTEVSIFTIMGAVVIVSTIFAFTVARQIEIVVRQILTLKDFRFQEVLNREKGVKITSFVLELADLQQSFFDLVLTFAAKIRMNRFLQKDNGEQ